MTKNNVQRLPSCLECLESGTTGGSGANPGGQGTLATATELNSALDIRANKINGDRISEDDVEMSSTKGLETVDREIRTRPTTFANIDDLWNGLQVETRMAKFENMDDLRNELENDIERLQRKLRNSMTITTSTDRTQ